MPCLKTIANTLSFVYLLCAASVPLAHLPPPPPALTSEEKIVQSEYVVVGVAQKLTYVETDHNVPLGLLEFDSDSPTAPPHRRAFIEVHVIDILCQKDQKDIPSKYIRVFLPGDFRSASERRMLYLNKELIYFLKLEKARSALAPEKVDLRYWFIRGPRASGVPVRTDQREHLQPYIAKHCSKRSER